MVRVDAVMVGNIAHVRGRLQIAAMPDASAAAAATRPRSHSGRALARNSLFNLLGLAAPLAVALFAIPPVVEGLGPERFGILGLVWVGVGYLGLLDLGLGRATTKYAAEALERGATDELASIARVASRIQLVVGLAGGLVVALLVPWLVGDFLDLSGALRDEARTAFLLMAATAPIVILANTYRGLLEAGQRFGLVNAVRAPVSTTNFLAPLVGVYAGWTLGTIVAAMLVVRLCALVLYAGACMRTWPALRGRGDSSRDVGLDARRLLGFGGWITVSSIVSPLLVYGDRFLVGRLVSVAAVGFYTVPHEMVTRLDMIPSALVATLFPAFAAGLARDGANHEVQTMFVRAQKYILCLIAPVLIALAVLATDVLTLWLSAEAAAASAMPLRLLALGMIANAIAFVPHALLQAAGRPDLTAKFHLAELPVHIFLVWLLVGAWGIAGAAMAWGLRVLLDAALLMTASRRLGLVRPDTLLQQRLPLVVAGLPVFAAVTWGLASLGETHEARIALVAGALIAWAIATWLVALSHRERQLVRSAVGLAGGPA